MALSQEQDKYKTFKQCSVCHKWRHVTDFYIDRSRRDGRMSRCKPCDNLKRSRDRQFKDDEKRKQATRQKTWQLVRKGDITLSKQCHVCGSENHLEIHHNDYDNPYDIDVLCKYCHLESHKI